MSVDAERLKFKEKLGFGIGDAGMGMYFQLFGLFLLYYYTDVFGLAPAAVGTMLLVTRILDAVSDPVMGLIADRTETRWGKFRPYLLWMALPAGLLGYAMFYSPDFSATGKLIYAYVTYSLMMLALTAIGIPYNALMAVISPSSVERTKVAAYRFVCAFTAGWLIATFVTPLKDMLGGGNEEVGFRLTMMIFAAMSVVVLWISFATTRERVHPKQSKSDIGADLRTLLANGPWIALSIASIFNFMLFAMRGGAIVYYIKYFVGDTGGPIFLIFDKTAVFLSLSMFALVAGALMAPALSRRFDKRHLMITLTMVNGVSVASYFFMAPDQYWLMNFVNIVGTTALGATTPVYFSMYADTADYGEWKTGRRTTGLVFSATMFSQKVGTAIGAGLSGYILALFGFVANEVQSDSGILGIKLMFSVFPAVMAILVAFFVYFYRIDDARLRQIERELAERRLNGR